MLFCLPSFTAVSSRYLLSHLLCLPRFPFILGTTLKFLVEEHHTVVDECLLVMMRWGLMMSGACLLLLERVELRWRHAGSCEEASLGIAMHHWVHIVMWTNMLVAVGSLLPLCGLLIGMLTLSVETSVDFAKLGLLAIGLLRIALWLGFSLFIF